GRAPQTRWATPRPPTFRRRVFPAIAEETQPLLQGRRTGAGGPRRTPTAGCPTATPALRDAAPPARAWGRGPRARSVLTPTSHSAIHSAELMDFGLSDDQRALQDAAADLLDSLACAEP